MGKKTIIRAASSSVNENSTLTSDDQQDTSRGSKNRALKVLGEYMRYFSSVNGLYRNIVHMQAEVVSRHGQRRWKNLSQEHQDEAFDRHIINTANSQTKTIPGMEKEGSEKWKGSCPTPRNRRDSWQSELDQDCFSGPFSWKSKSLQELVFPSTPQLNFAPKAKCDSKQPMDNVSLKHKSKTTDIARSSEDETPSSMTLDQLCRELRTSYEEQQAARLKIRQFEIEKNFGVAKACEGITKAAVKQRRSQHLYGKSSSGTMDRFTVASSELMHATQARQIKREIMCTRPKSEKSPIKTTHGIRASSKIPAKIPSTKVHKTEEQYCAKGVKDVSSPKRSPNKESLDFDEILKAAEEAHQKRANSSITKSDASLRRNGEVILSNASSQVGSAESKWNDSPNRQKITKYEISGDLSRDLRQRCDRKSESDNGNSDIMELFKNW